MNIYSQEYLKKVNVAHDSADSDVMQKPPRGSSGVLPHYGGDSCLRIRQHRQTGTPSPPLRGAPDLLMQVVFGIGLRA